MNPSALCSVAARRRATLVGLLALGLTTRLSAAAVVETDDRVFPTPAARWTFTDRPMALQQVTASPSGHAFLSAPGGIRFRDGKTAEVMTPAQESLDQDGATLVITQAFTEPRLAVEQRIAARDGAVVWELTMTAPAGETLWIEPTLRLPVAAGPAARYWDGRTEHAVAAAPFAREELFNTFPVSLLSDGAHGLAVGLPPTVEVSFLQNGIDREGVLFCGTRLVVSPGEPCRMAFVLFLVTPTFGSRDAVQGYYRRFPASFEPTPGVDPRLVDGRRTDTLQMCHYGGGVRDARKAVLASQFYGGYEWGYAPFRRTGDYVGRREYWEMDLTEGEQKKLQQDVDRGTWDRSDWTRFHQTRADIFRNADLRGNVSLSFYIVNHVDTALAERLGMAGYAFPRTRTGGLIEKNWVLPYDTVYYLYPWATPYEQILRRDLPEVVQELDLYAFAHDLYGESPRDTPYRGKLDYPLPGWSYDEEGPFLSRTIGLRRGADFIHTLKKGARTVGLIVNGIAGADPISFFAPDAYISESRMTVALRPEDRDRYIHCRLFAGHKPVFQHGYASGILLGDTVPWESLTPEDCRAVYDDFVRDYLIYLYQAGLTPSRHMSEVHEVISAELPVLLEVMRRGFEPAPACLGDPGLERVRYGAGLGAAVVFSNRGMTAVQSDERLACGYLGLDGGVIPAEGRGGELSSGLDGASTAFALTVRPMENRIITFPLALRSATPIRGTARCTSEISPLHRVYRVTLDLPAAVEAQIAVAPDPDFVVAGVTCDDEAVPAGAATRLSAGAHRIVVETVSALVHAPFEALAAFPLGDATVELPEGASEREAAAAQMIQDFIEVRLGKTLPRGPAAGGPAIQLGRSAEGQRRGVTLTGGTLDIRGTDAFDTQQVVWDLLRFLDRYDSRFTPIHAALYGSGDAATTEMLKKAGLLKQWVRAVQRDTRLAWNGFAKPERTAGPGTVNPEELPSIDIPTLEGPTVIDGRLDDDAWSQAAVFDSISMLRTGAAPTQATEVRMFRTSDALVVGFICHESAMHRVLAQMTARDSQVWNDDVFELRLAPGVDGTQATYPYYVFLINSIGTKADLEKGGAELAWNADWDGAVQRDAASWSGELRIPLAALNGAGAATWRGNVSRYEKPNAEYSTWSPIPESTADQPARFGILRMR